MLSAVAAGSPLDRPTKRLLGLSTGATTDRGLGPGDQRESDGVALIAQRGPEELFGPPGRRIGLGQPPNRKTSETAVTLSPRSRFDSRPPLGRGAGMERDVNCGPPPPECLVERGAGNRVHSFARSGLDGRPPGASGGVGQPLGKGPGRDARPGSVRSPNEIQGSQPPAVSLHAVAGSDEGRDAATAVLEAEDRQRVTPPAGRAPVGSGSP